MIDVPVIPENAPFSPEQRLWLNGFLAGYFSRQRLPGATPDLPVKPAAARVPVQILFGSQTGTAAQLAQRLAKEATARGCEVQVTDAAAHAQIVWAREKTLLIVTSTYGDGDMPDNAQSFWNWLCTDTAAAALAKLRFAVLALGDRNYEQFCAAGRKLDIRLAELGAQRLFPRADCDVDYEATAKAWMEGALGAVLSGRPPSSEGAPHPEVTSTGVQLNGAAKPYLNGRQAATYSKANPFPARLLRNVRLSKPGSEKEVRHYEISLRGSDLSYAPGDALGVVPANCPHLVEEILCSVEPSEDDEVRVGQTIVTLREALTRHLDLSKPSPELLAHIAERARKHELVALLSPDRSQELREWLRGRGVIDLLALLPDRISAEALVPLLRRLTPRLYSIASSPKAHPEEVHLTVNTVRYESHGRARKGVASTFLAERAGEEEDVKMFVQSSQGFRLPLDDSTPMVMVGPGTGIAPFRAFLEERQARGASGRNWLFFGDQKRAVDFLYEEQLCAWVQSGHLARLDLAFSRDQSQKIYVQHRMLEQAAELWAWLQDGAHFYVCGDAARMAKDVDAALHQVAEWAGGKSPEQAAEWVSELRGAQRYQRDVY